MSFPKTNYFKLINFSKIVICFIYFTEIYEDIREECSKFGRIRSMEIPKPIPDYQLAGVGKVCQLNRCECFIANLKILKNGSKYYSIWILV